MSAHHGMTPTEQSVVVDGVRRLVRAIVVDRPGCALSDPLGDAGPTPGRLRDITELWMVAVIEALAGEPADVVASSAGGFAALVPASRRPRLVRSLALLGAPAVQGMNLPMWTRAATIAAVARVDGRGTGRRLAATRFTCPFVP